jgi:hypothetical protein
MTLEPPANTTTSEQEAMDAMAAHVTTLQRTSSSLLRGEDKVSGKTGSVQILEKRKSGEAFVQPFT